MPDIKDRRPGGGGASGSTVLYHDEGDGTWSESFAAHLRVWDGSSTWVRVTGDPNTGALYVTQVGGKTLKRAVVALAGSGDVIAAVANKRIKAYYYALQSRNDSMAVQFTNGNGGAAIGLHWDFNAREGAIADAVDPPNFLVGTTASSSLFAVISGAGTVDIEVSYFDDDAV